MKNKLFFISLFFVLAASLLALTAQAQSVDSAVKGLNETAGAVDAFKPQVASGESYGTAFLATKTGQIVGLILSFVGVLFLGLMIYAGINWMTANGNEQKVSESKDMIINAAIGIVIVFAAYAITSFLGTELLK
ncbi:MAG: hypothetical protein WC453_04815 [Patescibacteria group bacterium]